MVEVVQGYAWVVKLSDGPAAAAAFEAAWSEWSYDRDDEDELLGIRRPSDGRMVGYVVDERFTGGQTRNKVPRGRFTGYVVLTDSASIAPVAPWRASPWTAPPPGKQAWAFLDDEGVSYKFSRVMGDPVTMPDGQKLYRCEFLIDKQRVRGA